MDFEGQSRRLRQFPARLISFSVFTAGVCLSMATAIGVRGALQPIWTAIHEQGGLLLLIGALAWTFWLFVDASTLARRLRRATGAKAARVHAATQALAQELLVQGLVLVLGLIVFIMVISLSGGLFHRFAMIGLVWASAAVWPLLIRYQWGLKLVRQRLRG